MSFPMATHTLAPVAVPAQGQQPLTITSEQINRYAEIVSILTQLEKQKDVLRGELIPLHHSGAQQEQTSPYLLQFIEQQRRTVDWKAAAMSLAAQFLSQSDLVLWEIRTEANATVQQITQVRVTPNASYAANLKRPCVSEAHAH